MPKKMDIINQEGQTPLHLAAMRGDKKTVILLLKQGAGHKNIKDKFGLSPLDYAFKKNNSFIVSKLKSAFPQWTFKDEEKLAEEAYAKFIKNNPDLINNKQIFDPDYFFNERKVAPYFKPGNKYSLANIKSAVSKKILDPHKLFVCGNLLQSTAVSRVDMIGKFRWLLTQGVDPNIQASHELNPSSYKNTALHTLIANEDEEDALAFINLLVYSARKKFNFNLTDSEGKTCLCLAVKVGLSEVAKKLISLKDKVDVNIPDEDGNTPLHYAFLLGHVSIAQELLKNKSDENAKNKENKTAYALLNTSDVEDVRNCLETIWINPDRKIGNLKKTYIQQCMENREIIANKYKPKKDLKHVLALDQKINIDQKKKSIIFLIAAQTGNLTKLQENCDSYTLNACNSRGNTALHLACEYGHGEIVSFLLAQPGIDLAKKNNENIKAVTRLSQAFLVPTLFKEKLPENREDSPETIKNCQCGHSRLT